MGIDEINDERLTAGFVIGTVQGTIISAPINYSAYLLGFKYTNPISSGTLYTSGTVGISNINAVLAQITTQRFGTITGTIDVVELNATNINVRDSFNHPVGRLEAGDQLVGVVINTAAIGTVSASIMGVVEYRWIPGRLTGP